MSTDELYIVLAYETSVLLISNPNKDGSNMKILLRHYFEGEVLGSCVGSILTNDNNYIISTVRNYGIVLIDVTDKKKSKQLATLFTMGGETVKISNDGKYAFVSDGFKGFKILDLEQLPELKVVGFYEIPGWTNHLELTDDSNYLIASTMDYNMISLFDIHDKSNPLFLQKLLISQQHAQASCIEKNLQFGFILNEFPLRFIPFQSQVKLHTEIAKLNKKGEIISQKGAYSENQDVRLGESILIHFTPIYFKEKGQITKVYHYSKTLAVMQDLPSNMVLQSNGDIIVKVEKSNLDEEDKDDESLINQNHKRNPREYQLSSITLVVMISIELDQKSFIFNKSNSDPSTSLEESKIVWSFLKDKGCLNSQNLVQNDCHKTIQIPDSIASTTDYQEFILNKLSNSYYYNPIIIKIKSSFSFDQDDKYSMIESISDYIELSIDLVSANQVTDPKATNTIPIENTSQQDTQYPQGSNISYSKTSKFVDKQYKNVIHTMTQQQRSLKLSGNLKDINKLLAETIVVSFNNPLDIIEIHINDFINYQINRTLTLGQAKFMSQKTPLKRTDFVKSIQDQIASQYKNSVIDVSSPFQISLDRNTFTDLDGLPIKYTAYLKIDGEYIQFHDAIWIKFDQELMKLFGTPPDSSLFTTVQMKIVGSNGIDNSNIEEYFYLNIYSISLQFTVNVILRLIGPLAFIFSLYRYRIHFLNTLFRERSLHSNETAFVNQVYRKRITLVGENMKIAEAFFHKYLRSIKTSKKKILDVTLFSQKMNTTHQQKSIHDIQKGHLTLNKPIKKSLFNKAKSEDQIGDQNVNEQIKYQTQQNTTITSNQKRLYNHTPLDSLKINKIKHPQKKEIQNDQTSNKNLISNHFLDSNFSSLTNSLNRVKSPSFGFAGLPKSIQSSLFFQKNNPNLSENIQGVQRGNNLQTVLKGDNDSLRISQPSSLNNQKQLQINNIQTSDFDAIQLSKYLRDNTPNMNSIDPELIYDGQLNFQNYSSDQIQKVLLYPDGMLNINLMMREMMEYELSIYLNFKRIKISDFYKDLNNPNSFICMCFKTLAGQYLINKDKRSQMVYKYLQKFALKNFEVTQNDWYKAYVKIDTEVKFDKYNEVIPFPSIQIKENVLDTVVSRMNLNGIEQFDVLVKYGVNILLLKELLKQETIGLNSQDCRFMKKCVGESLHLYQQRILSVEAFKRSPNTQFSTLKKWTNRDFQRLPISKNMSLPSWMSYDCKKGVITLEGTPTQQDQDELLIRIFDNKHYILYQFFLNVVNNEEIKDQSSLDDLSLDNNEFSQKDQKLINDIEMQNINDSITKPSQVNIDITQQDYYLKNEQPFNDNFTQTYTNNNLDVDDKKNNQMKFSFNNMKNCTQHIINSNIVNPHIQQRTKLELTQLSDGKLENLILQDKSYFEPSILQDDNSQFKSREEIDNGYPLKQLFLNFDMNSESKEQKIGSELEIDEYMRDESSISINNIPNKQFSPLKITELKSNKSQNINTNK